MTKDEALRLALEAFEYIEHNYMSLPAPATKAITAIKAALEAKDEPVVWNEGVPAMLPKQKEGETFIVSFEPKLEAKDEPMACKECHLKDTVYDLLDDLKVANLKLSVRSQRTWVGLTDMEIDQGLCRTNYAMQTSGAWRDGVEWASKQLQERNS